MGNIFSVNLNRAIDEYAALERRLQWGDETVDVRRVGILKERILRDLKTCYPLMTQCERERMLDWQVFRHNR